MDHFELRGWDNFHVYSAQFKIVIHFLNFSCLDLEVVTLTDDALKIQKYNLWNSGHKIVTGKYWRV